MAMIDYALEKSIRLLQEEMSKLDVASKEYAKNPTKNNEGWLHLHVQNVESLRMQVAQIQRIIKHRIAEHGK
ncbi:MAG: hypothetical protein ACK5XN_21380 [Bacteroidota bacterium]|jgi:hypothetical protein